jgi:hypothetical protein
LANLQPEGWPPQREAIGERQLELGPNMIHVTEKAATKIQELLAKEGVAPATGGLRVGVQGGGCSGLTYAMRLETQARDRDKVIEENGNHAGLSGRLDAPRIRVPESAGDPQLRMRHLVHGVVRVWLFFGQRMVGRDGEPASHFFSSGAGFSLWPSVLARSSQAG